MTRVYRSAAKAAAQHAEVQAALQAAAEGLADQLRLRAAQHVHSGRMEQGVSVTHGEIDWYAGISDPDIGYKEWRTGVIASVAGEA